MLYDPGSVSMYYSAPPSAMEPVPFPPEAR